MLFYCTFDAERMGLFLSESWSINAVVMLFSQTIACPSSVLLIAVFDEGMNTVPG